MTDPFLVLDGVASGLNLHPRLAALSVLVNIVMRGYPKATPLRLQVCPAYREAIPKHLWEPTLRVVQDTNTLDIPVVFPTKLSTDRLILEIQDGRSRKNLALAPVSAFTQGYLVPWFQGNRPRGGGHEFGLWYPCPWPKESSMLRAAFSDPSSEAVAEILTTLGHVCRLTSGDIITHNEYLDRYYVSSDPPEGWTLPPGTLFTYTPDAGIDLPNNDNVYTLDHFEDDFVVLTIKDGAPRRVTLDFFKEHYFHHVPKSRFNRGGLLGP
jgi:hypothetical protein